MKVVLEKFAFPPVRAFADDAGLDLRSPEDVIIGPGGSVLIDTGVHVEIPKYAVGFLKSKSGLMCNHDITSDGTVDCGFTGSIKVKLFNHGTGFYTIHRGDKISQLVVQPILLPDVEIVSELPKTDRGTGGLGSTGK